jgi:hypothetical protein
LVRERSTVQSCPAAPEKIPSRRCSIWPVEAVIFLFQKSDFSGFACMRRRDASIWFMIAAAVFAALALLALLLVYGPA